MALQIHRHDTAAASSKKSQQEDLYHGEINGVTDQEIEEWYQQNEESQEEAVNQHGDPAKGWKERVRTRLRKVKKK